MMLSMSAPSGVKRQIGAAELRPLRMLRRGSHDLRPLLVEVDEALSDGVALAVVGAQELRLRSPAEDGNELPAEVVRVLHGDVHALAGLGAVRVAGVPRDEDARQAGARLV